jgi:hypothetical protein
LGVAPVNTHIVVCVEQVRVAPLVGTALSVYVVVPCFVVPKADQVATMVVPEVVVAIVALTFVAA